MFIELPVIAVKLAAEILEGLAKVQEDIFHSRVLSLLISICIVCAGIPFNFVFLGWFGKVISYTFTAIGILGIGLSIKRLLSK
jgi:Sec-independent protein secretion pathway component TatC